MVYYILSITIDDCVPQFTAIAQGASRMARKKQVQEESQPANLSIIQVKAAIPKLQKRIKDVEDFCPEDAAQDNGNGIAQALKIKINQTLTDMYGHNTIEYRNYEIGSLYSSGVMVMTSRGSPSLHEKVDKYTKGKQKALTKLQTALSMLEETLENSDSASGKSALLTLAGCDLHPAINAACSERYKNGHYADAIEAACKALNALVQAKSGNYDLADTELMQKVFSPKNPVLAFNDMKDRHDEGEQQGMMFLYKGVYLAFRNQRAHKLIDDTPEDAFSVINTIDFLSKKLNKALLRT